MDEGIALSGRRAAREDTASLRVAVRDNGANSEQQVATTSEKLMQTFRMPRDLVAFLKMEAARGQRDLTAHVVRLLQGVRAYFGLPEAATALLEADRKALGMERYEYLLHVLFQRSLELREKGAGYDAPHGTQVRRP